MLLVLCYGISSLLSLCRLLWEAQLSPMLGEGKFCQGCQDLSQTMKRIAMSGQEMDQQALPGIFQVLQRKLLADRRQVALQIGCGLQVYRKMALRRGFS
jgi:hypothetical protein